MASSEVDQKFLGRLAKAVENDNPLLAAMLFKILGLSINLSQQLVQARKQRLRGPARSPQSLELYFHIIWLSREGLVMLEQYVLPVVGKYVELKVLAYKLRASFYHIFVLFYNQPPVSTMGLNTPDVQARRQHRRGGGGSSSAEQTPPRPDKGKGIARSVDDDDDDDGGGDGDGDGDGDGASDDRHSTRSSLQPTHPLEGGPVHPPPGFGPEPVAAFLLPTTDYLPLANRYFKDAIALAEDLLWGSHSLRLSVKTEYAAFLYECVHDADASRQLAKDTIAEVYEATEGIDNDMFADACELVTVLGKMMKRGLSASTSSRQRSSSRQRPQQSPQQPQPQQQSQPQPQPQPPQQQPPQPQPPQHPYPQPPPSQRPAPRVSVPPPGPPPSTSAPLHPDDMAEFI